MEQQVRARRRTEIAIAFAAILVGAGLVFAIPDLRHSISLVLHGDFAGMRRHFRGLGAGGVALLLAVMLAHAVIFYPTEIVSATIGYVYGFGPGLVLAIVGWTLSGWFAYFLGRALAQPVLLAMFGRERFMRVEGAVRAGGVPLLIAGRFIPIVPFSLLCYAAGAARVPFWRFTWTTVVGFLPQTAAVVYLGSKAKSLSLNDPIVWVIVAVALMMLFVAHRWGLRGRFK
jgi:uncharacterized membrane protein YdjX (TVP38/TMEM64 family)